MADLLAPHPVVWRSPALKISQVDFARQIGVSQSRLNEIIHGKRSVTPDTAMRFERALGMTAQFCLNLQLVVDLFDANTRRRRKKSGRSSRSRCRRPPSQPMPTLAAEKWRTLNSMNDRVDVAKDRRAADRVRTLRA